MTHAKALIVLVGLPGAGKSTVGRGLAARLGWRFIDLDQAIEGRASMTVARIFEERGEAEFRRLEAECTRAVAVEREVVLAPGGGWIVNEKARNLLGSGAMMVWLQVSPESAVERLGTHRGERPLLAGERPLERMRQLLEARVHAYSAADLHLDTEGIEVEEVIRRLVRLAPGTGSR